MFQEGKEKQSRRKAGGNTAVTGAMLCSSGAEPQCRSTVWGQETLQSFLPKTYRKFPFLSGQNRRQIGIRGARQMDYGRFP